MQAHSIFITPINVARKYINQCVIMHWKQLYQMVFGT